MEGVELRGWNWCGKALLAEYQSDSRVLDAYESCLVSLVHDIVVCGWLDPAK